MYLVHQIIVYILYATLFCIFVGCRRHMDGDGSNIDTPTKQEYEQLVKS